MDARCVLYQIIIRKIERRKIFKDHKKEIILPIIYQSDLLPGTQTACKQRALELSSHYCYVKNNMIHSKILWEGKKTGAGNAWIHKY